MDLNYEAGLVFKRGDLDTAAWIIAEARGLKPDHAELWDQREIQIKCAETERAPLPELLARRQQRTADHPTPWRNPSSGTARLHIGWFGNLLHVVINRKS
jgi:hypothetical protein